VENYYYLVAALPELTLDHDQSRQLKFGEIMDLIERNLKDEDLDVYKCLLFQNDNRNLLHLIFHEFHGFSFTRFQYPSYIPIKVLKNYRNDKSELPEYMIDFLTDQSGSFSSMSHVDIELLLRKYFLAYVNSKASIFLQSYYEWLFNLERILADLNQSKYDFLPTTDNQDAIHIEQKGNSYSFINYKELINEITPFIEQRRYGEIENTLDTYYWQFAERWTDRFSSNAVFAYTIKLLRLAFWRPISSEPEDIEKHFRSLIDSIQYDDRLKIPTG